MDYPRFQGTDPHAGSSQIHIAIYRESIFLEFLRASERVIRSQFPARGVDIFCLERFQRKSPFRKLLRKGLLGGGDRI